MVHSEIGALQRRVGAEPDGFWGPRSIAACRAHLHALMPHPSPWPLQSQSALLAFYGSPGNENNLDKITFPFATFYQGKQVLSTRVHEDCAHSLMRILEDIQSRHGDNMAIMRIASDYAGVYNFRNKRGGNTYSLHAYGAAIDIAPATNGFKDSWPVRSNMPLEIIECFYREGWISGAAEWGYDAMHFQATQ